MINIVVAIAKNNVIGKNNKLPWHYPEDLRYFKNITSGKTVVMGKNTFLSIVERNGKVLPNRKNVVLTHDKEFKYKDVTVIHDVNDYLNNIDEDIYIIGGSQVYHMFLPFADRLYITHISRDYEGDTYFPEIEFSKYDLISEDNQGDLSFCVYQRKGSC